MPRNPRGFYAYQETTNQLMRFTSKLDRDSYVSLYSDAVPYTSMEARSRVPYTRLCKAPDLTATFEGKPVAIWEVR